MIYPKVTIITPSYNHKLFISKCLDSVLSQSYRNWEQIIVDDFSTDGSFDIANSYAKKDKRIKIIHHNKNWGIKRLADNYNQALRKARGKYIAILESDDYWPKDKLQKQIEAFKDKKVVLSFGDCILINKSGLPIKLFTYAEDPNLLNNKPVGFVLKLFYKLSFSIIPVTVMIRKNVLVRTGGFKKDKIYPFTDIPTFLSMAIEGRFAFVDEIMGFYRKQQDSYWFNFASQTTAMGREEVKKSIINFVKTNSKNKNIKNFRLNINSNDSVQDRYIRLKKAIKPLSLFVNRVAFNGKISLMSLVFLGEFMIYKFKKLMK